MIDSASSYIQEIEALKNEWKYPEARQKTQIHLRRYVDDYRLYEELADIYLFEWNLDKAEESMELAQKLHADSATWTYLMGYIHIARCRFSLGIQFLEKANMLFPNNPEILRNIWWGYARIKNYQKGSSILRRALNLAPDDELIIEDLGMVLVAAGDRNEGLSLLRRIGKDYTIDDIRTILLDENR
jgi:tetratricopeptide (TPR) repeat protein